jgi:hypothetical protein
MIDRTATLDGKPGDVASIPGSRAWSASTEVELQEVNAKFPYWVLMLLASGFEGENLANTPAVGDATLRLTPSVKTYANWTAATNPGPATVSLSITQNVNETSDYVRRMRGCTGVASFTLNTGEIAKMSNSWKGLVVNAASDADDFLDSSDVNVSALGSTSAWTNPYVVKNISLTILDATSTSREICVQSITINTNANHPDFFCPSDEYGTDISPVLFDTSPTVDLTFPDGETVQPWVFAQFRNGATFSLEATLVSQSGGERTITFNFPSLQFNTVTLGDAGGFVNYTVNCKAVRSPGAGAATLFSIDWAYQIA